VAVMLLRNPNAIHDLCRSLTSLYRSLKQDHRGWAMT
jgi:hypothetical protein